jgi:hypothetical protein
MGQDERRQDRRVFFNGVPVLIRLMYKYSFFIESGLTEEAPGFVVGRGGSGCGAQQFLDDVDGLDAFGFGIEVGDNSVA